MHDDPTQKPIFLAVSLLLRGLASCFVFIFLVDNVSQTLEPPRRRRRRKRPCVVNAQFLGSVMREVECSTKCKFYLLGYVVLKYIIDMIRYYKTKFNYYKIS